MFITKWIDINERLPKNGQECLIYTKYDKISKATWRKFDDEESGMWYSSGRRHNSTTHWMPLPLSPFLNCKDDDFGTILVCAVRYALGRESYMPSLVIDYVRPLLPILLPKTLSCMERDIREAENFGGYGDEKIDKPEWIKFLKEVQNVMEERRIDKWL